MDRYQLTDEQWEAFSPYLTSKNQRKAGRPKQIDDRQVFEGILWILKTDSVWRDLPEKFGKWQTVYKVYVRLLQVGLIEKFQEITGEQIMPAENDFSGLSRNYQNKKTKPIFLSI